MNKPWEEKIKVRRFDNAKQDEVINDERIIDVLQKPDLVHSEDFAEAVRLSVLGIIKEIESKGVSNG